MSKNRALFKIEQPKPDARAYRLNLENGLRAFPERRRNYLAFNSGQRIPELAYHPVKMDIEPTSRCNFRCAICQASSWKNSSRAKDLSFGDFKKLLDGLPGLVELKLQGIGEPLLNKDLFKMIRYARARHIWVRTSTNASLLHYRQNYKELVDSGINEVQVSVDGVTKEVFETVRRGANFELIKRNCMMLNDYCRQKGVLITRMWTVLQKENIAQLSRFPELAAQLGFKRLTFSYELTDWGIAEWSRKKSALSVTLARNSADLKKAIGSAKKEGVRLSLWGIDRKYGSLVQELCPWPFSRAYISSDKKIVPCCMIANPQTVSLGSAVDFLRAWNSKVYQEFRRQHLHSKLPVFCRNCYASG